MFFGHQSTRVDDKGRVKLSSDFKAVVDRVYGDNKFYITSKDGIRIQLWPLQEWMKKLEIVNALPQSNPIRQRFLDVTSGNGLLVDMDASGRLLLPQELRETAKATGDVNVVSNTVYLEVVNAETFKDFARPMTAEELAAAGELGL